MKSRLHCLPAIIPVLYAVSLNAQSAPSVTATPTAVTFTYQAGGLTLPSPQTLSVRVSSGTPTYSVTITGTNTLWLTATPDAGKLPATLSVRANPTSLSTGTYTATIVVTVTGVTNPLNIPVTLNVTTPLPTLTLSTSAVAFTAPPVPPLAQTVRLATSGSPLSFTVQVASAPWLTVSPMGGVLLPGSQAALTFTVDTTSLSPSATAYTARVTVNAPGATAASKQQAIAVSVTVNSMTPSISSVWPASVPLNSPATTLTIRGTNFYNATLVKVTGQTNALQTTVLGADTLLAVVPASLLNTAGTLKVYASNPQPGGDSATVDVPVGNTATIGAIVNAGSMVAGSVAPGELITIFGTNIGPSQPAVMADSDSDGYADQTLGGVTATVDNVPAPLVYVSSNQINLQVPYGVTQGTNKQVSITNGTSTPATATVTIDTSAPGIFTLDGSGAGQAALINANATINGPQNTAKAGDSVMFYITGEGDYATGIIPRDGYLIPLSLSPLPQMSPLPTVTIGGISATVTYAGPVPGWMLGLLLLQVTVPTGVTPGNAVPIVLTIGTNSSQPNVTMCVK